MRRTKMVGLVLGASLLMGMAPAAAQTAEQEPDPGPAPLSLEQRMQVHREHGQPAVEVSEAAETSSTDVEVQVTEDLCLSQRYPDPDEGDDSFIDVATYEMGYDCLTDEFVAAITTHDSPWPAEEGLGFYDVEIDIDGNLTTGCGGAEYSAALWWDETAGQMFGDVVRWDASCGALFASAVTWGRTDVDDLVLRFPQRIFSPGRTLRWQQFVIGLPGFDDVPDFMPDGFLNEGNFQSTLSDPCHGRCFYLRNTLSAGPADIVFRDTEPASQLLLGDWNADGVDSFGFRSGNTYKLKNTHAPTAPDVTFSYGAATDQAYVGDWDGDGVDTVALRRGNTFYVKNSLSGGAADVVFSYGQASDGVLVGDWDGDGDDTIAVRRDHTYYVRNSLGGGSADVTVSYGRDTDVALAGDWDADGDDTLGMQRENAYLLRNTLNAGAADVTMHYGAITDIGLAGDWNADGRDTIGVRR